MMELEMKERLLELAVGAENRVVDLAVRISKLERNLVRAEHRVNALQSLAKDDRETLQRQLNGLRRRLIELETTVDTLTGRDEDHAGDCVADGKQLP